MRGTTSFSTSRKYYLADQVDAKIKRLETMRLWAVERGGRAKNIIADLRPDSKDDELIYRYWYAVYSEMSTIERFLDDLLEGM